MVVPATVFLGLGMMYSGILAVGDARARHVGDAGRGPRHGRLDPLFIFVFGMGVDGAAVASIISRIAMAVVGWRGVTVVHQLTAKPHLKALSRMSGRWPPSPCRPF